MRNLFFIVAVVVGGFWLFGGDEAETSPRQTATKFVDNDTQNAQASRCNALTARNEALRTIPGAITASASSADDCTYIVRGLTSHGPYEAVLTNDDGRGWSMVSLRDR